MINSSDFEIHPIEVSETFPSLWNTDQEFHDLDLNAIILNSWQYAGHISELNEIGDYVVIEIANRSVVITRSSEKSVKAFYNICKHRGGPLVEKNGNQSRFKCMYHGWTYSLEGELKGTPEFDGVKAFDKCDYGLTEISLEIWQGLIFIHLGEAHESISTKLTGIEERISPIQLSKLSLATQTVDTIKCNWKLYVENYMEGYHLPHVHPGLSKLLDYKSYKTEIFPNYSLQFSPFKDGDNIYSASDGEAYYYFIFPNIMLNILPGRLQVNRINPLDSGKCNVHFDYFYENPNSSTGKLMLQEDLSFSTEIQNEDIDICERVQKNLASGVYKSGRFSVKRELGVYDFQTHVKRAYQSYLGKGKK